MVRFRIWLYDKGCAVIMWLHRGLRGASRWLFTLTLPPHKTNLLYKKWYIKRQELMIYKCSEKDGAR
jgi:hypothetical protein